MLEILQATFLQIPPPTPNTDTGGYPTLGVNPNPTKEASNVPTIHRVFLSPTNNAVKQNAQCWKDRASVLIGKQPVTQQVSIDKRLPTGGLSVTYRQLI